MDRREFLKTTGAAAIAVASGSATGSTGYAADAEPSTGSQYTRALGRTGERVSMIGLGGFHIGKQKEEQESIGIIRAAIDQGITFMDNSWDYNGGASETRMGKALRDGYRGKVFLMTKLDGRTRASAVTQIDDSLKRLQVDHVDLMQIHEVIRLEDADRCFARGGAIEALLDAKKAGKIRYIGFTGHKDPMVHLRMLEVAARHDFQFDTVQMPLNVMDAHFRSFEHQVLPVLVRDGIGVLGMKSMADGLILRSGAVSPGDCLRYALNLPTSVVITGIDSMKVLDQAVKAMREFQPLGNDEIYALLSKTAQLARAGEIERYKTSNDFDSTAWNPDWLG